MNNSSDLYNFLIIMGFLLFISYYSNKNVETFVNNKIKSVRMRANESKGNYKQNILRGFNKDEVLQFDANSNYGPDITKSMQRDYQTLLSLGADYKNDLEDIKIKNVQETSLKVPPPSSKSGFPVGLDNLLHLNLFNLQENMDNQEVNTEVHMVYADWCGHSKRAKPAFESLTHDLIETNKGEKVKCVLTEVDGKDKENPGGKERYLKYFKDIVNSFPTFMVVKDDKVVGKLNEKSRKKEDLIEAIKNL